MRGMFNFILLLALISIFEIPNVDGAGKICLNNCNNGCSTYKKQQGLALDCDGSCKNVCTNCQRNCSDACNENNKQSGLTVDCGGQCNTFCNGDDKEGIGNEVPGKTCLNSCKNVCSGFFQKKGINKDCDKPCNLFCKKCRYNCKNGCIVYSQLNGTSLDCDGPCDNYCRSVGPKKPPKVVDVGPYKFCQQQCQSACNGLNQTTTSLQCNSSLACKTYCSNCPYNCWKSCKKNNQNSKKKWDCDAECNAECKRDDGVVDVGPYKFCQEQCKKACYITKLKIPSLQCNPSPSCNTLCSNCPRNCRNECEKVKRNGGTNRDCDAECNATCVWSDGW